MAGTNAITYSEVNGTVKKISMDWLSDASGDVNSTLTKVVNGQLLRAVFVSDTGDTQPTDLYDVTIEDEDGADVLGGVGGNIARAAVQNKAPKCGTGTNGEVIPPAVNGTLELKVAAAGNAKGGEVHLYLR